MNKKPRPIKLSERTWRELQKDKREMDVEWDTYFRLMLGMINTDNHRPVDKDLDLV